MQKVVSRGQVSYQQAIILMNKLLKTIVVTVVTIVVVGFVVFYFRGALNNVLIRLSSTYIPCQQPIAYSIGSLDPRFGISESSLRDALTSATDMWEQPIDKNLFVYDPKGSLKINLIYDVRQEATEKLNSLGIIVDQSRASFDSLRATYDTVYANYITDSAMLTSRITSFEERKNKYEAEVKNVNNRGRGKQADYDRLNTERDWLNQEVVIINQMQDDLNAKVDELNALVTVLNGLADSLNLEVTKFNQVGATLGEEFEEGNYQSDHLSQTINIYQFNDQTQLIRVLAHEFGHALGLDHIESPTAIMYRLNNGINKELTDADLVELKKLCRLD